MILLLSTLTITRHRNVEAAIQSLPPSAPQSPDLDLLLSDPSGIPGEPRRFSPGPSSSALNVPSPGTPTSHTGEEAAQPLALPTPSLLADDARRLLQKTGDSISKPLNALGRIFSDVLDGPSSSDGLAPSSGGNGGGKFSYLPGPFAPFELGRENRQQQQQPDDGGPIQTPYKPRVRRGPPSASSSPGTPYFTPAALDSGFPSAQYAQHAYGPPAVPPRIDAPLDAPALSAAHVSRTPTPALDFVGMQAEIDRAHARASEAARETLAQIFPGMDSEVRDMVLEANGGDLGRSIEALLEMSSGD